MLSTRALKHVLFPRHMPSITQLAGYRRQPKSRTQVWQDDDGGLKPKTWVVEDIEERLTQNDYGLPHDVLKEDDKLKRMVKYKTIQRKFFKEPQESNLLTWDAKNQIRFLLKEYPETWTVDRIVESFPITRSGVIHLLRSSWQPMNEQEILKHDKRVKKHWMMLKDGKKSGPVSLLYQELASKGSWDLICNAAGIRHLPKPEHRVFLSGGTHEVEKRVGKFEMIVKAYCEQKHLKSGLGEDSEVSGVLMNNICRNDKNGNNDVVGDSEKNDQLLKAISDLWREKFGTEISSEASKKASDFLANVKYTNSEMHSKINSLDNNGRHGEAFDHEKEEKGDLFNDSNTVDQYRAAFLKQDDNLSGNINDDAAVEGKERRPRGRGKRRRARPEIISEVLALDPDVYSMKDTLKIGDQNVEEKASIANQMSKGYDAHRMASPGIQEKSKQRFLKNVKFSAPVGADEDNVEPYVYDAYAGYLHPFGKYDPAARGIKIPEGNEQKKKLYRKGNAFYSKDGEFLFKTP